jgi:hypothetical protein
MGESTEVAAAPSVRFITDEPADKDSFNTHSVLAGAITEAIFANDKLRIIGLLGRWGSGKSTVIQYLTSQIERRSPGKYKVFTYDAWLHQNDQPRRSFLEDLVSSLETDELIDGDKWDVELKYLSGVLQKQDKVETPVLTTDAKFLFLFLLPVPLALSLIDADTVSGAFGATTTRAAIWSFWLAVGMLAFPVLSWTVRVMYLRHVKKRKAEWFPPFLVSRQLERNSTLVERSPDPDSLEFGRKFQQLMVEVSGNQKKLIIVIDNIDRIGDDDALVMWANIRSFFLASHRTDLIGHEPFHPVVILPVDDQAIRRLFEERHGTSEAADSFLSKTFDASFTVPTPVMSDWRAFLAEQLRYAFGSQITDHQIFQIRRFMEEYLKEKNRLQQKQTPKALTPREINRFINSIISLYLQWDDRGIDVVVVSYFVVFRREIDDDVMKFVLSKDRSIASTDRDWQKKLAALHFGVVLEKAAQVLIEEPLIEAIGRYDGLTFREYASIPGFGEVFADLTSPLSKAVAGDTEAAWFYLNAACLLATLNDPSQPIWTAIAWDNLSTAIGGTIVSLPISERLNERLQAILPHVSKSSLPQIAESISSMVSATLSGEDAMEAAQSVRDVTAQMIEVSGSSDVKLAPFPISATLEQFLGILLVFRNDEAVLERLQLYLPDEETSIDEELVALAQNSETAAGLPWLVQFLNDDERRERAGLSEVDWAPLLGQVAGYTQDGNSSSSRSFAILPLIGELAATGDAAVSVAQQCVDQGWVETRLAEALAEADVDAIAAGYSLLIWRGRQVPNPGSSWGTLLRSHPNLVDKIISYLFNLNDGVSIEPIADCYDEQYSSRDLLSAILSRQVENNDLGSIFPDRIGNDFYRYSRIIPYSLRDAFIDLLLEYEDFEGTLKTAPWGDGLNSVADHLSQQGEEKANEVRTIIFERLNESDGSDLRPALEEGEEPFRLLSELNESQSLELTAESGPYRLLSSYLPHLLSATQDLIARWFDIAAMTESHAQRALLESLAELMLATDECPSLSWILESGGKALLSVKTFSDEPTGAIEKVLFPAIRKRNSRVVIQTHKGVVSRWVRATDRKTKARLQKRLDRMKASTNKERSSFARAVVKQWIKP